jgi:hypothetical protein
VGFREEPHPRVEIPLAAHEQEEREREHCCQSGDEPGGTNGYSSGGGEEVLDQRSQFVPKILDLVAEPIEEPTEPGLLGEPLEIFRWPLGSLSRSNYEVDQTVDLVDQQGQ